MGPCPSPCLHLPYAGLSATTKIVPPEGEMDHRGWGVCVLCSVLLIPTIPTGINL